MFGLFQYQKKQIRQPGTLHLLKVNPNASNFTTYHQEVKSNTLKNIDLGKILELVEQGVIGNLVEVEAEDGSTIQIFVE